MKKLIFILLAILVMTISATAQLVNHFQKNPDREGLIKAYEKQTIVKLLDVKYVVTDINYFYIDSTQVVADGGIYTKYQWASDAGLRGVDSMNLTEVKMKNLKTSQFVILRYMVLLDYSLEFTRKKHRK